MSKNTNTILFICAATVFNVITFFAVFLAMFFLFIMVAPKIVSNQGLEPLLMPVFVIDFIAAILLSFLIYRMVLGYFLKKIDQEKFFTPILQIQKKPPKVQKNPPKEKPSKEKK
ncbi:MAG: hypothetical protein LBD07_06120 [Spirochaetaceae bacterium]|jgi:hypothetical protein|nr:hypothetical protein [Spirochaetaceae bacterium]